MTDNYIQDISKIIQLIQEGDANSSDNEKNWTSHIDVIHQCIDELVKNHPNEIYIHKLQQLKPRIHSKLSFEQLQHFTVPFDREIKNRTMNNQRVALQVDQYLKTKKTFPFVVILDHLRSAENVGSIIRTSECFGAEQVVFCGYTPDQTNQQVKKVSMGAQDFIQCVHYKTLHQAITHFKNLNFQIIGVELADEAKKIEQDFINKPTAFIFGNERFGLSLETIQMCDEIRYIPLFGIKNSLNVSVCTGIILYEWTKQWQNS